MELFTSLKNSLLLPKKEALFRLNRISMRNTIVYVFVLMFLLLLPDSLMGMMESQNRPEGIDPSIFIIQMVVFYPLMILFVAITLVSVLAGFALLLKQLLRRKLKYQQLWKMTAYAMTIPFTIYAILSTIGLDYGIVTILLIGGLYYLLYKMIVIYPKVG
ncbi:DUF1189 domain-containing protein [Aquibacillus koreensis]|uniref:DUF1189 domain-containing protein n=1 Tax=Aquibacillus koreensis TaxID=279446 RepID=A0A9X3WSN1_9BACI|nr:DUF1189 domain-containing protein [Aquibacillus koreensis]MCT2535488.1 DUF1189 domain-containing protein [Aquibacillus koreensis]MDC3422699.1 DUF1189 domain-containing protein [Aquibacillus koreensis]